MQAEADINAILMPDLPAIVIELLVQGALVGLREVAIVFLTHIVFLLVDGPQVAAVLMGLRPRDLTVLTFGVDPVFLVVDAVVDLVYAGMVLQMGRLMAGALCK